MESKRLETLLTRYWNCVSTRKEEEELRRYFSEHSLEVPNELKDVGELFKYYESERGKTLDSSFETELRSKLSTRKPKMKVRRIYNLIKVAAAVTVVGVASYFFRQSLQPENRPELLGTYEDPEQAFEETKKAFALIASKLGKGTKHAEKIGTFNKAENKIKNKNQVEKENEIQL